MADISIAHQHGLSLDEAKEKTNQIVSDVQDEFPDLINTIQWNGDKTRADVKGKGFAGLFKVDDSKMSIDIDLSFFAKPFKGKVQEKIQSRIDKYFA
ncbi:MAG: polyhydroxyalkanoic acid system family protein [Myxococcota bacterium]|jgi:putative polyhydroxyalkanoate system protein|nr:polyhydroxyalkanoic acid system family protein [Myxococcota bacterium]